MRLQRFLVIASLFIAGCHTPANLPGPLSDGRTRLPNGWILSPAGQSILADNGYVPLAR